MNYWLVKSEPAAYSWDDFVKDRRAAWTGVRNFQARNNLRAMKRGDLVVFYHSGSNKRIVGIARAENEAYADPTSQDGDWSCVDLVPVKVLTKPLSLKEIKADKILAGMPFVRQSRLSVTSLTKAQFDRVTALGQPYPV